MKDSLKVIHSVLRLVESELIKIQNGKESISDKTYSSLRKCALAAIELGIKIDILIAEVITEERAKKA